MLGNLDDAEDALQDALLKAYRNLAGLRDPGGFRAWMLRIVYHQCLDQLRRQRTRREHEQHVPARLARSTAERSAQRDVLRRVGEVLLELPPKQRAVLHLRVFEELDYREIGAVVGLTPRSARVYAVKARRLLRERLADELALFLAPKLIGSQGISWSGDLGVKAMSEALLLKNVTIEQLGADLLLQARL
jgi:RNA polymerase sigma factor (sigma-70 family)